MSNKLVCRLCLIDESSEYIDLYGEDDQPNEIHEVMVHYFHAEMLSDLYGQNYKHICAECWRQINDFHNYQIAIVETQKTLLKSYTLDELIVEEHDDDVIEDGQPYLELIEEIPNNTTSENVIECYTEDIGNEYEISEEVTNHVGNTKRSETEDIDVVQCSDDEVENKIKTFRKFPEEVADETKEIEQAVTSIIMQEVKDKVEDHEPLHKRKKLSEPISDGDNSQDYMPKFEPMGKSGKEKSNAEKAKESDDIIAQWLPTLECLKCHESFPSFTTLKVHHRKKHGKGEFGVMCCSKTYTYRCQIEEHVRLHLDPNAFMCMACGRRFTSRANFTSHRQSQCIPANTINKTKSHQESDERIAKWRPTLPCELCSEVFPSFTTLKEHSRRAHPREEFQITCCDKKFFYRSKFEEHAMLHLDANAYKCDICGKVFATKSNLQIHKNASHAYLYGKARTTDEDTAECDKTRRSFKKLDDIIAQWRPILECIVCTHKCKSFTELTDHFRLMHKESELYITCCGRKLGSRARAMVHASRHLNPDSFACEVCGESYTRKFKLHRHMRLVHPNFETVLLNENTELL
ncbi:uncharacterized protein LOC142231884 [Haematobia irritans]|uniref:uncharacterized protein LOC142231884 n=1 Tax=Haematobia irritans TaxID=7368 RepID=UPI003F502E0F